jgi:hypothetical protein
MSTMAKKEKRLQKAGYTTKKGQFGAVRIDSKKIMKGGGNFYMNFYKTLPDGATRTRTNWLGTTMDAKPFKRLSSTFKEVYTIDDRKREIYKYLMQILKGRKNNIDETSFPIVLAENGTEFIIEINNRTFRYKGHNLYIELTPKKPRMGGYDKLPNSIELTEILSQNAVNDEPVAIVHAAELATPLQDELYKL